MSDLPESLRPLLASEIWKRYIEERRRALREGKRWGSWRYNPTRPQSMDHDDGYWYPLDKLKDSATTLDAIAQIAGKTQRFSDADVGAFVRGLDYLFDLQATVCSRGQDTRFDVATFLGPEQPSEATEEENDD